MKKVLIFLYVFLLVAFFELVITYFINELYISKYEKGEYEKGLVKSLFVINYLERYIPYYNYGNYFYKTGDYDNAALEYEKALEKGVPKKRVCSVRINLSLALTNTVTDDMTEDEKIAIYERAKEVLYEDNCAQAGSGEGGESEEAEQLEDEIEEKEQEAKEDKGEEEEEKEDEGEGEEEKTEKEQEEEKSSEVDERNKDAGKNRQDKLDEYKDREENSGNYYSGKKW